MEQLSIKSTGELVLGNEASETLKQNKASIELNYDKKGFNSCSKTEYYLTTQILQMLKIKLHMKNMMLKVMRFIRISIISSL